MFNEVYAARKRKRADEFAQTKSVHNKNINFGRTCHAACRNLHKDLKKGEEHEILPTINYYPFDFICGGNS